MSTVAITSLDQPFIRDMDSAEGMHLIRAMERQKINSITDKRDIGFP